MGDEWATAWLGWPDASRFWGQVIGYTLPAPGLGLLQLQTEVEPDGVVILTADGVTAIGQTVDLAQTEATLTTPGGREIPLTLRQVAPGRYQQRLHLPDPGAYQLSVTQTRADEPEETGTSGFVMPYPAEYGLPVEGTGEPLLKQIANITRGRTFSVGEPLQVADCKLRPEAQPEGSQGASCEENKLQDKEPTSILENLKSQISNLKSQIELWPWLLLAALILWPIEIAWRRWGRLRIQ